MRKNEPLDPPETVAEADAEMIATSAHPILAGEQVLPLPAASFEFSELESALEHAAGLKTEAGQANALERALTPIVETSAMVAMPIPEGCELGEIELEDGTVVRAPVAIAATDAPAETRTPKITVSNVKE